VDFGDRGHASKALQEIGPAAEKEVAKYVDHQDWGVRMEACNILKVVGTKNSLEALRKAQQDGNGLVKMAADAAAQACARR
jgi:HEAT repeat protein